MSTTIESLELQVQSSATSAVGGIDALASSLGKLKNATKGGVGLTAVAKQLTTLNSALNGVSGANADNLNKLAQGLQTLSSCGNLKLSSSVAAQITNIGNAVKSLNGSNFSVLSDLANTLAPLSSVGKANLNSFISQLNRLPQAIQSLNSVDTGSLRARLEDLTSAFEPMTQMGKNNLTSFVTQLKKLPEAVTALQSVNIGQLASQIQQLADAFKPLATEMQSIANGFSALPTRLQRLIQQTNNLSNSNNKAANSYVNFAAKIGIAVVALKRIASVVASWIAKSNEYIESLNLFTVSMGQYASEAKQYAERVAELMGIDPAEWMKTQGIFMTLASGFGVASDKAYLMSKNLTQLGYDMASFFNMPVEESMQKLQSALAGELEPVRRVGYDLSQAALKQIALDADNYTGSLENVANALSDVSMAQYALNQGIGKSYNEMTQAEKSQLRYIALMKQVRVVQGDMARTLESPANQIRILQAQVTQCARALGNIFIPALNAVLPYAIALAKAIRILANAIASLFGFALPKVDYSGVGGGLSGIGTGAEEAADGMGGAAEKAKELKNALLGIDELNVISEPDASGGGGGGFDGEGLDFELPGYDFLNELVEQQSDEILRKIQAFFNEIGEIMKDPVQSVVDLFGVLIGQFEEHDWLTAFGTLFLSVFGAIGEAIEVVTGALKPFVDALDLPEIVFKAIETLTTLFENLAKIFKNLKPGLEAFSENFLKPVGEWIKNVSIETLEKIEEWLDEIGDWFDENSDVITTFFRELGELLRGVWHIIEPIITLLMAIEWERFSFELDILLPALNALLPILSLLANTLEIVAEAAAIVINALTFNWDEISTNVDNIAEAWGNFPALFEEIGTSFERAWTNITEGCERFSNETLPGFFGETGLQVFEEIEKFFKELPEKIYNAVVAAKKWFVDIGNDIIDGIEEGLQTVWQAIEDFVSDFVQGFKDALGIASPSKVFKTIGEDVVDGLLKGIEGFTNMLNTVSEWAGSVVEFFVKGKDGKGIVENFKEIGGNIVSGFKNKIGSTYSNAKTTIVTWASSVKEWFTNPSFGRVNRETFATFATNVIDGFKNRVSDYYTSVKNAISTFASNVKSWFTNTVSYNSFYNVAADVIKGFKDGIGNLYETLKKTITNWGESIISWFKGILGSNSPSKVFKQIGEDTVLGYNIGLASLGKTTRGVVNDWANSFTSVSPIMSFAVDTSALRYYDSDSFAKSVSANVSARSEYTVDNSFSVEGMKEAVMQALRDTGLVDDVRRQADKHEQTVVQIGNRTVSDAVITQQKANGYVFAR